MNETVVETNSAAMCGARTCNHCQSNFEITQGDLDFYDKISPTFAGQRFHIPTPTLCPDCRQRRRLSFRNERKLYRRICDATQQPIISIYSPDKPYKVYDQKMRRSDSRDAMDYGFEFDFTKTFTENFRDLIVTTPLPSQFNTNSENSDYCNHAGYMKNCYLCSASRNCENILYASKVFESEDSIDILSSTNINNSYELINCEGCYKSSYLLDCNKCSNSNFLVNCNGCDDCFMSYNLVNQKYVFCNKQYSKEEYENKFKELGKKNGRELFQRYDIEVSKNRTNMVINCENCSGHRITNSQNCFDCYNITNAKDCKYIGNGGEICEDVYDGFGVGYEQSLAYEIVDTGLKSTRNLFAIVVHRSHNMYYCFVCYDCKDCFGCVGLRNKQYCIFNRQYENKEKYEIQVAKIIQHMQTTGERGEFFHPSLSPFGYNETVAQEYYPLHAVGASLASPDNDHNHDRQGKPNPYAGIDFVDHGYSRSDYQAPTPQSDKIIKGSELPDIITIVEDSILQYAISCEVTGQLFRIQPQELAFYRKHNIPLPRKHPDQRHLERLALRK